MLAGDKDALDCVNALSATGFADEVERFDLPRLIVNGDDQIEFPTCSSSRRSSGSVDGMGGR